MKMIPAGRDSDQNLVMEMNFSPRTHWATFNEEEAMELRDTLTAYLDARRVEAHKEAAPFYPPPVSHPDHRRRPLPQRAVVRR